MAKVFNLRTAQFTQGFEREAIYNALDTIATLEIDNTLEERMTAQDKRTMNFYLAMQGPALEMTLRGIKVDEVAKAELFEQLQADMKKLEYKLQNHDLIQPIWDKLEKNTGNCRKSTRKDNKHVWQRGVEDTPARKCECCGTSRFKIRPFLATSDDDVKHLFYDLWELKPQYNKEHKVTADKEARGKLIEQCRKTKRDQQYIEPLEMLSAHADIAKQHGFLKFKSPDGRFHAGFNVGVTKTHRWSSNEDAFGRGGNAQNITEKHRHIFTADKGYKLCYADLKQAESNVIAHKAGDERYIEAHAVGDTHTYVCRLVWPEGINGQEWTGDITEDKKIATSACPLWDNRPGHDYRFQSKAVQHGSNLGLTAFGLAIQKHIPVAAAREAQRRYFRAFPGIPDYQRYIRTKVENCEPIVTPLGVRFKLFGRPWDEHTYKQGLAVIPQSMVGHVISIGIYRIWTELPEIQLLAQVHDAILFQYPEGREDLVAKALECMTVSVPVEGVDGKWRTITIGTEAAVGYRWAHHSDKVPDGIKEIHL